MATQLFYTRVSPEATVRQLERALYAGPGKTVRTGGKNLVTPKGKCYIRVYRRWEIPLLKRSTLTLTVDDFQGKTRIQAVGTGKLGETVRFSAALRRLQKQIGE